MKRFAMPLLVAALALSAMMTSCLGNSGYVEKLNVTDDFNYADFLKDNADSIYHNGYFIGTSGANVYNVYGEKDSEEEGAAMHYVSGCSLSMKCDPIVAPDHETRSEYCVADTTDASGVKSVQSGIKVERVFVVFYQHPEEKRNLKNDIVFYSAGEGTALSVKVCNTALLVNLAKYGKGEIPAFQEGDYLKLTFKAFDSKDNPLGSKTVDLIKYEGALSLINDWKKIDFGTDGSGLRYDYIDLVLSSNRTDIPLYCCLDDFETHIYYER